MVTATRRHLSHVLALALLASLLTISPVSEAASAYDNVERVDVGSFTAAGIAVSKRVFPSGADAAVLTRDDHFPDALAASALAAKVNGPVLFTDTDSLTTATASELDRVLDPGDTVYVTGGPVAISQQVEDQVRDRGYRVTRLEGPTRIETAVAIGEFVGAPASGHALIARAWGPPGHDRTVAWVDSVTCGAYANDTQTPVLLTPTEGLADATESALADLGVTDVTICGGPDAVSETVADDLRAAGVSVERVWGATRVETGVEVAKQLFGHSSAAGHRYLLVNGYGENFGWGLAATPLAGALDAPILLVGADQPTSCSGSEAARATLCFLETVGDGRADLTVIGAASVVDDAVREASAKAAGGRITSSDPGSDGPLATPTGVTTSNVSTTSEGRVTVSWTAVNDPDGRLAGYNVYYGTDSPDTRAGSSTPTVGPDTTTFTVGALQLDTTYTFAVTSVTTDGKEPAKSSAVTEKTTAPSVDLSDPTSPGTSPGPATVDSNAKVPITFSYDLSQGGTYQLMYKTESATGWKPFSETGSGQPLAAGSHEKTLEVVAPANNGVEDVDYWLRVAVYPTGGSTSDTLDDVEADALRVLADLDERVQIDSPTATTGRATVFPGDPFDLTFTYSTQDAVSYRVSYRESGTNDAFTPFDDPDATGDVVPRSHDEQITVELDSPSEVARYELFVELLDDSGAPTAQGSATDALVVREAQVILTAPTATEPAVRAEDGSLEVTFDYVSDVERGYEIAYRASGGTDWTTFPNGQGMVLAASTSSSFGPVDVGDLPAGGTYNIRVALRDTGDTADDANDTENGALVIAAVTLTDPAADKQRTVDGGDEFPVTFRTNADGEYRLLYSTDSETWSDGAWAPVEASPDGVTKPAVAPANETSSDVIYDLRLEFRLGTTGDADASHEEARALVVSGQSTTDPDVNIISPTFGDPEEIPAGSTFTVQFETPNISSGSYRIVTVDDAGSEQEELVGPTSFTFDGEPIDVDGVEAPAGGLNDPATNTHNLRVEVTDDGPGNTVVHDDEPDAVRVADVEITAPTSTASTSPDAGGTMTVSFAHNTSGAYKIFYRTDANPTWTGFGAGAADTVSEHPSGDEGTISANVTVPDDPGTSHDILVVFKLGTNGPMDATDGDATHEQDDAFTPTAPSTGPTIEINEPPADAEERVDQGSMFDIEFTASVADGVYQLLWRQEGGDDDDWVHFAGDGAGTTTGAQQPAEVAAPPITGVYDLRAELDADPSDGPADLDDNDENLRAIEVTSSGGADGASVATVVTAPACIRRATSRDDFGLTSRNLTAGALDDLHHVVTIRAYSPTGGSSYKPKEGHFELRFRASGSPPSGYTAVPLSFDEEGMGGIIEPRTGVWTGQVPAKSSPFSLDEANAVKEYDLELTTNRTEDTDLLTVDLTAYVANGNGERMGSDSSSTLYWHDTCPAQIE